MTAANARATKRMTGISMKRRASILPLPE